MENESFDINYFRKIQLDMLYDVERVAAILNVKFILLGGTMLGAVRHKGFIPWDDDIDIGLLRPDYNRFIRHAQEYLNPNYFLQTYATDKEYYLNFAKVRDSRTTFIESSSSNLNINHGAFVDIFPIDFVNPRPNLYIRIKKTLLYNRIFSAFNLRHTPMSVKSKILKSLTYFLWPNIKKAVISLDKLSIQNKPSELMGNIFGAWGPKETMDASIYQQTAEYEFEGRHYLGPKDADTYLTNLYGDYMTLPPIDKRVTHHHTDIIDLYNSYTKYRK